MILLDVNVLVYAYREETPDHGAYKQWLDARVVSDEAFGLSDDVASGFVRVVTHPAIFAPPAPIPDALGFIDALRRQPNYVHVAAGDRHWPIFDRLCRQVNAKGNLVPDAYLAALAIEWGCELATADRGFARFGELRLRHPLDELS